MARSDRLIKLNRANESRANLAWGMQWIDARRFATLVGTTRREKPDSLFLSRVSVHRGEPWGERHAMGTRGVANLTTLNDAAIDRSIIERLGFFVAHMGHEFLSKGMRERGLLM